MHCSKCGEPLAPGAAFCSACGSPLFAAAAPPPVLGAPAALKRPALITALAVLQLVSAAIGLLVTFVVVLVATFAEPDVDGIILVAVPLAAAMVAAQVVCGIGLIRLRPYGRTMQLVLAWIGLIGIPIGTIISILILVYMFKPGIRALFSGRGPSEFTAEELAQIDVVNRGSAVAVVALAVVALFLLIAVVGIIAAIAIPGLVRARMAGNEASAIGSLRAINSAQSMFASTCAQGAYAATLAGLAAPARGGHTEAFISRDLASDPVLKSGYDIHLVAGDPGPTVTLACNGAKVAGSYFASAEPATPGVTGNRYFATNATGMVFESPSPIPVTFSGVPAGSTPIQ